jgi:hypothetical protein
MLTRGECRARRSYLWEARRARRNRLQAHEVRERLHLHAFKLIDAARIRAALDTPIHCISFAVGPLFSVGATLFCLGSAARLAPGAWEDTWPKHKTLLLINIPLFVRP